MSFIEYYSDHVRVREATKLGYAIAIEGDSINLEQPNSKTRRGRVGHQIANTLTTSCNQGVVIDMNDGFVNRKYEEFYSKNGYIPNMFNPYNCNEIDDYSPTMTTQCGSTTSSSTVLIKEDNMNKLMQVGQLEVRHEQSNRIYSEDGICPTIMAGERKSYAGGYVSPKIMVKEKDVTLDNNGLIVVGNTVPSEHTAGRIFNADGLSPTVMYRNSKVVQILDNKGVDNMWNNNLEKLNFEMEEIKVFDIFAGIGALHQSLKELGVPVRVTNLSEVDIDATISYAGGHIDNFKDLEFEYPSVEEMRQWLIDRNIGYSFEKNKSSVPRMKVEKLKLAYKANVLLNNLGDISKIDYDKIEDFDLMNMSFCCQDLSNAGKQRGMINEDGIPTRSGLYVYSIEAVRRKKPKYIMIENVKALIQKKFIDDFYSIISELEEIGYNCYYPTKEDKKGNKSPICLNSKDFGIPQNRERIFVIAIRKDIDNNTFKFPIGKDQGLRLKDVLEDQVDEKYYIEKTKKFFIKNSFDMERKGNGFRFEPHISDNASVAKTITTRAGGRMDDNFIMDNDMGINENKFKFDSKNPILTDNNLNPDDFRIRKLTPLECWRLMGFRDETFYKAQELGISDSQLYKQAGNSIVVNCLYYIFKNLFKDYIVE